MVFILKFVLLFLSWVVLAQERRSNVVEIDIKWKKQWIEKVGDFIEYPLNAIDENDTPFIIIPFFDRPPFRVLNYALDFGEEIPNSAFWRKFNFLMREIDYFYIGKNFSGVQIVPIFWKGGKCYKVSKVKLFIREKDIMYRKQTLSWKSTSVLSTGEWIKIAIMEEGFYKIPYDSLAKWVPNISDINPKTIKIYGNISGQLPYLNSNRPYDDLEELPIIVKGEEDGIFNLGDYILFYGEPQNKWFYDVNANAYKIQKNYYSDTTYYFLTWDGNYGKRIPTRSSLSSWTLTTNSYDCLSYYEKDVLNPIKSGLKFYFPAFNLENTQKYTFNFFGHIPNSLSYLECVVVGRSITSPSSFRFYIPGSVDTSVLIPPTGTNYYDPYGFEGKIEKKFTATSSPINLEITFTRPDGNSSGLLDYVIINTRCQMIYNNKPLIIRDNQTVGQPTRFVVIGPPDIAIFDITNPLSVVKQEYQYNGGNIEFSALNNFSKFICLTDQDYLPIFYGKKITNQNLHGSQGAKLIIVSAPELMSEAKRLADWHNSNGLNTLVTSTEECYNEFSTGSQDPMAIRLFLKMLYDKALLGIIPDTPKYLLLFGDGSYDNKNILKYNKVNVPTYQTLNSLEPLTSYISDDFYGYLDDMEDDSPNQLLDIGIGRIQASTLLEAKNVVDKIIRYKDPSYLTREGTGRIVFIGDDEDGALHMSQADALAENYISSKKTPFSVKKIYLDYYPEEETAGGQRYPLVNKEIKKVLEVNGTLLMSYTGHGGPLGWAHERIFGMPEITSLKNDFFPLCATFTCEFTRFDDPTFTSAGDWSLINKNGGFIALVSTVRLVFASSNFTLASKFFDVVFSSYNKPLKALGDIVKSAKNALPSANTSKFGLFGDPAISLNIPVFNSTITSIFPDTIYTLTKTKIQGMVVDTLNNPITNWNGSAVVIIYAPRKKVTTLGNNGQSPFSFTISDEIVFKGLVSVNNGLFSLEFIPPIDIKDTGAGKIQAIGNAPHLFSFLGGLDTVWFLPRIVPYSDNSPPKINLYLNDSTFVNGSITNDEPTLIAHIYDENGINLLGYTPGTFIHFFLDNNRQNYTILSDYFIYELNSYQKGSVKYKLPKLSPGSHTLTLVAYDSYNNRGEASISFYVVSSDTLVISNVYNYPNPFSTNTSFYFQHNQPGVPLDVKITIYTLSGRKVKEIKTTIISEGFTGGPIPWNGFDDYQSPIARGFYLYSFSVSTPDQKKFQTYGKIYKIF